MKVVTKIVGLSLCLAASVSFFASCGGSSGITLMQHGGLTGPDLDNLAKTAVKTFVTAYPKPQIFKGDQAIKKIGILGFETISGYAPGGAAQLVGSVDKASSFATDDYAGQFNEYEPGRQIMLPLWKYRQEATDGMLKVLTDKLAENGFEVIPSDQVCKASQYMNLGKEAESPRPDHFIHQFYAIHLGKSEPPIKCNAGGLREYSGSLLSQNIIHQQEWMNALAQESGADAFIIVTNYISYTTERKYDEQTGKRNGSVSVIPILQMVVPNSKMMAAAQANKVKILGLMKGMNLNLGTWQIEKGISGSYEVLSKFGAGDEGTQAVGESFKKSATELYQFVGNLLAKKIRMDLSL